MAKKKPETVESILADIEKRLDDIEDVMSFMVRSNQLFKEEQRVQFSAKAERAGITRTKGGVRKGTVKEVGDGFTMKVLMDGYAKPRTYHHAFFEKVGRR